MRRTGKTTRLVNEAIEYIFKNGELVVFNQHQINKFEKEGARGQTKEFVDCAMRFIDVDSNTRAPSIQQYFIDKLRSRLEIEHQGSFEVDEFSNATRFKVRGFYSGKKPYTNHINQQYNLNSKTPLSIIKNNG